jgi:hypothetical protein
MKNDIGTKDEADEIFEYCSETGSMKFKRGKRKGDEAGSVRTRNNLSHMFVSFNGVNVAVHRLAWLMTYGEWPKGTVDHRNGIGTDNRLENLRDVTHQQNQRNMKRSAKNTSGVCGVSFCKRINKWRAQVEIEGKQIWLGYHATLEDASRAREAANSKHGFADGHGKTNVPVNKKPE